MLDNAQETNNGAADNRAPKRLKSTVAFPYANLEEVAAIAKAMYGMGGVPMTRDQIANLVNASPDSSTFIVKLSSARTFGVLAPAPEGKLVLTDLGHRLVGDGPEALQARVEAFLNVELYHKLVEHFQGKRLPPPKGLEAAIVSMGVSERQGDKARQAFDRSAAYAGYFNATKDRLVAPVIAVTSPAQKEAPTESQLIDLSPPPPSVQLVQPRVISGGFDPLIEGMLQRLPAPGSEWPLQRRVQWLRTLAANLAEVYPTDGGGEIIVKLERDSA